MYSEFWAGCKYNSLHYHIFLLKERFIFLLLLTTFYLIFYFICGIIVWTDVNFNSAKSQEKISPFPSTAMGIIQTYFSEGCKMILCYFRLIRD